VTDEPEPPDAPEPTPGPPADAPPADASAADAPPAAGRLLVAVPALRDPNFVRSVVLLLDHDEAGSFGVILNRPTTLDVGEVLASWRSLVTGDPVVHQGGPVAQDSALGLAAVAGGPEDEEPLGFRRVWGVLGLIDLDADVATLGPQLRSLRIFAGYAGWGPGQLDAELAEGSWIVIDALPGDAFDEHAQDLWQAVLRRQPGRLAWLATYPSDPSLN
jgi:putative transcriptional regulator